MNRLLTILLLLGATAHGQIDNPPTTDSIGLGPTNDVTFNRVATTANGSFTNPAIRIGASNTGLISVSGFLFGVSKGESVFGASPTSFTIVPPATFSTNVNVNATLAVTGDTVLSGVNNTMPGATSAASGSSLMTRNLYDERLPLAFGLVDQAQGDFGTVTLANGATGTKAAGGFDLITGSSNNATAVWNASSQANFGRKQTTAGSAANATWSTRVMVGWWFTRLGSTSTEIRLQYGRAFNATTHAALSARGVGVRIVTNSVFFETHNGTSGFETTNAVALTVTPQFYSAIVEAGVAKFYAGQTLVATVTNNVPTNNIADNEFGWVMSISNTSTNTCTLRVFANPGFVMQQ